MSSVTKNYVLNLINTGSQMLFPLLTFPYACRVMGAESIGVVNFLSSIVAYVSLFASLGIPIYAVREVARLRDDPKAMNKAVAEILSLNGLLTLAGLAVAAAVCLCVGEVRGNASIFIILCSTIVFNAMGCEWLYLGIEDFKYVTIRGLVVKVVSVVYLFVFVRTGDDLILYTIYTVVGSVGGNIFNFIRLRKIIGLRVKSFAKLNMARHLKPVLQVFSLSVVTSLYLQLNPVILGFLQPAVAVGFFAAATKLLAMVMKLSSCLGTVMLPRMSNLVAEGKKDEMETLLQKSYDFTLLATLPLVTILMFCSADVIAVLCGDEFAPAVSAAIIVAPIILVVGISNVCGMQALYPMGKIKLVVLSCSAGAAVDLLASFALVPSLSFNGTALAYLLAEVTTTLVMLIIVRKHVRLQLVSWRHIPYFLAVGAMVAVASLLRNVMNADAILRLFVVATVSFSAYLAVLLCAGEPLAERTVKKFSNFLGGLLTMRRP